MTQVVVGAISDQLGFASGWEIAQARHAGRNFDARRTHWACPADRFRPTQPGDLPLQAGHGGPRIGTVQGLELRAKLWVVAVVDDGYDLSRRPWQLSYDLTEKRDGYYDLNAVAVVERSATVCMPPVEVRAGTLADVAGRVVYQHGYVGTLIKNAHEDSRWRKRDTPLRVRGLLTPDEQEAAMYAHALEEHYRSNPHEIPRHNPGGLRYSRPVPNSVLSVR